MSEISRIEKCLICGKEFRQRHLLQKTCSHVCYYLSKRYATQNVKTICVTCGSEFHQKRSTNVYCGKACRKRADYLARSEQYKESARRWKDENPERAKANKTAYYQKNKEEIKAKAKAYRASNLEEVKKRDAEYKERTRHGGVKKLLVEENGLKCSECDTNGNRFNIVGHHVSLDNTDHENQVLLCRSCHARIHMTLNNPKKRII